MDRESFNNHAMITGNEQAKKLVNCFLDKIEERNIAYFIAVRNGATKQFTLKAEGRSDVIATVTLPKDGMNIQLQTKFKDASDISETVLDMIKKSYLG